MGICDLTSATAYGDGKIHCYDKGASLDLTFAGTLGHGNSLDINGVGFGTGTAEAFFDRGDVVREKGVDNNYHSTFIDDQLVYGSDASFFPNDDINAIWAKPTTAAGQQSIPQITTTRPARHVRSGCHYYTAGGGAKVAWPSSEGGVTPDYPPQDFVYVAWYLKIKHSFAQTHSFEYSSKTGALIEGETVDIKDGGVTQFTATLLRDITHSGIDYVVWKDAEAWGIFTFTGVGTIVGQTSGQTITVTGTDLYQGPEKLLRLWDDVGGTLGRATWDQWKIECGDKNSGGGASEYIWNQVSEDTFFLLESFYDKLNKTWSTYLNGEAYQTITDWTQTQSTTQRIVPAGIGWEGIRCKFNEVDFGDIYIDYQKLRVIFTDAATWGASTIFELQPIDSRIDTKIVIEQNFGALSDGQAKYAYILDTTYPVSSTIGLLVEV